MASLSKQSSSGKPKLERRNAIKVADYEPSDTPRSFGSPSPSSSFRTLDKGSSKSFRLVGLDSHGEIEKICKELGIVGGADAFGIPPDVWEKRKEKPGSVDRFIRDHQNRDHQTRSRSLDEPVGSFYDQHRKENRDGGLARSPLANTDNPSPSPFYNSMTSSSGDSMASDSSFVAGERGFFGSFDTPTESGLVINEVRPPDDHQQPGNVIQQAPIYGVRGTGHLDDRVIFFRDPPILETRLRNDRQTHTGTANPLLQDRALRDAQHLVDRKGNDDATRNISTLETRRPDNRQTGNEIERVPRLVVPAVLSTSETNRPVLRPPPGVGSRSGSKSFFPDLSTLELLSGFGPDESDYANQARDHDDAALSDPEDNEADVTDDKAVEEFDFVSDVVQQHGTFDKQQSFVEDNRSTAPSTPERSPNLVRIQSWRKLEMLGSGSFGTVYEGMSEDGIYFAVKEVSLSEHDSKAQQCVKQLEQEIEFLSKFQHENIVRYLGTQKQPDKLYIFLELVTKGSLSSLYAKYTLFDSQIRSYTRQILSGLKYLHERKVMHRDIKCANILVDVNGKIKVADFGLAKQISQLDELKSCKGSAYWMAPEVIDPRQTYSFPADIWSLGCTVLEMETRRPPFGDMEWTRALWKVGHGEAPPIPDHLSEDSKDFIRKCLEVDPAKRPSARQLLEHPFVRYAGTGLTPRNSFTEDMTELPVITEN